METRSERKKSWVSLSLSNVSVGLFPLSRYDWVGKTPSRSFGLLCFIKLVICERFGKKKWEVLNAQALLSSLESFSTHQFEVLARLFPSISNGPKVDGNGFGWRRWTDKVVSSEQWWNFLASVAVSRPAFRHRHHCIHVGPSFDRGRFAALVW